MSVLLDEVSVVRKSLTESARKSAGMKKNLRKYVFERIEKQTDRRDRLPLQT
jgi:hypothetical protein